MKKQYVYLAGCTPLILGVIVFIVLQHQHPDQPRRHAEITNLPPDHLVYEGPKFPRPPQPFHQEQGAIAESDALEALLKYMPNATDEQKRDIMGYTYHMKSYRLEWQQEIDQLKSQKAMVETNATLTATDKDEMLREWGFRWKTSVISLTDVATRLNDSDRKTMLARGYPEALINDLWSLANPTGRMPWEE